MFIIKNYYYFYIENTQDVNLNYMKRNKKIFFIYRNNTHKESLVEIIKFRKICNIKKFKFYIANNHKLAKDSKADGLYLSSYNKKKYLFKKIKLIGSAHNFKEIFEKIKQGCNTIILSRLFQTSYKNKNGHFGVVKFNLLKNKYLVDIVPLGGINNKNLLKLNLVKSNGFAILSEIKKKPAISNRLF